MSIYDNRRNKLFDQFNQSPVEYTTFPEFGYNSNFSNPDSQQYSPMEAPYQQTLQDIIDKNKATHGETFARLLASKSVNNAPTGRAAIGGALQNIGSALLGSIGETAAANKALDVKGEMQQMEYDNEQRKVDKQLAAELADRERQAQAQQALEILKQEADKKKRIEDMLFDATAASKSAYKDTLTNKDDITSGDIRVLEKGYAPQKEIGARSASPGSYIYDKEGNVLATVPQVTRPEKNPQVVNAKDGTPLMVTKNLQGNTVLQPMTVEQAPSQINQETGYVKPENLTKEQAGVISNVQKLEEARNLVLELKKPDSGYQSYGGVEALGTIVSDKLTPASIAGSNAANFAARLARLESVEFSNGIEVLRGLGPASDADAKRIIELVGVAKDPRIDDATRLDALNQIDNLFSRNIQSYKERNPNLDFGLGTNKSPETKPASNEPKKVKWGE